MGHLDSSPPWALDLGFQTVSLYALTSERNRRLSIKTPYWLQVVMSLPTEIRDKVDAVCLNGVMMKCKDDDGSLSEVSILALDASFALVGTGQQDNIPLLHVKVLG